VAASEVAARFALDEVVFVPTGQPWQKAGRKVSQAEDRYLMTVVATASNPRFSTSRIDIEREGNTYTVDTLAELRALVGEDTDLFFITGADALSQILTWRGAEKLFDLAHFIGVSRPGLPLDMSMVDHLPADRVTLLEVPALSISSTDCRRRITDGLPIWYLVPDGIVQYIAKRGLYRDN
jgi:nicotinate-nucleotide adenylyltransferase